MHELHDEQEPSLDQILARLSPCDLVIVEGYKTSPHPKIEVRRTAAQDQAPLPASSNVVTIAADHAPDAPGIPVFDLGDIAAIADFFARTTGLE